MQLTCRTHRDLHITSQFRIAPTATPFRKIRAEIEPTALRTQT